jgi:IstB-like ATP binding protein
VLYQRVPKLFAELAMARGDGRYARIMRTLNGVQLPILDDWGLETLDTGARRDLYEILEGRYGRRSTILTSQVPVDKSHEVHRQQDASSGRHHVGTASDMMPERPGDIVEISIQMRRYMSFRQTETPAVAAAKSGFATSSGYRFERDARLPSQKRRRAARRRSDPLGEVWDREVVPLLKSTPGLRPVAIFDEIRRHHPEIGAGIRHTLERVIRSWRALNGAEQDGELARPWPWTTRAAA